MRALIQRVSKGSVTIEGEVTGAIARGYVILVGITHSDTKAEVDWLAKKILELRLFEDDEGKMNRSLVDVGGELLVVSQFTLYADARKGRRPSFTDAAPPEAAIPLYEAFVQALRSQGVKVETGRFGANMQVEILNDGPVTLWLEREAEA
ncbi:D-tyrosyl-tRNA(Tyr) deacylase [bacterium]|nr:D-tyrosyl-tRNA(Tyr) deacylase [bacterium]